MLLAHKDKMVFCEAQVYVMRFQHILDTFGVRFWIRFGYIVGMFGGRVGHVLATFWVRFGCVFATFLVRFWYVLHVLSIYYTFYVCVCVFVFLYVFCIFYIFLHLFTSQVHFLEKKCPCKVAWHRETWLVSSNSAKLKKKYHQQITKFHPDSSKLNCKSKNTFQIS